MMLPQAGRTAIRSLALALGLGFGLGCVSGGPSTQPRLQPAADSGPVDEINLLAIPVALNLDARPGPDGFVIKIYASNKKRPKPVPLENGTLEVLMFDGIPGTTAELSAPPLRTWTYPGDSLRQYEIRTSIGIGYQFAPQWGDAPPAQSRISVVARYTSREGATVTSAPSIISVALK